MKYSLRKNLKKGFTLIELLVVIAIIGLLSTVVLGSLTSARVKAEAAKTKVELNQIRLVLEQYYNDYGGYPYPGSGVYCLGTTCTTPSTSPSGILTEFVINNNSESLNLALASVPIPLFKNSKVVDGWSGYVYVTCTDDTKISSSLANSGFVCPGDPGDSDVTIITPVGNDIQQADASAGFVLGNYSAPSGGGGSAPDSDGDGIVDSSDNCPSTSNPYQEDTNYNGTGDACEGSAPDSDGDGIVDSSDNCPSTSNPYQEDTNYNGTGDACEGSI